METTISIKELSEIITTMSVYTLKIYLSNYKFNKFKTTNTDGIHSRYLICEDFLSTLYTYFWYKNRIKEAEKLKRFFKTYRIKCLEFEEFVK